MYYSWELLLVIFFSSPKFKVKSIKGKWQMEHDKRVKLLIFFYNGSKVTGFFLSMTIPKIMYIWTLSLTSLVNTKE